MKPPSERKQLRRRRKGPDARLTYELDQAWGRLVRTRGFCERCEKSGFYKLDAAHIVGRQNFRLRWEPRNGMALCYQCHRWWHDYPLESATWIRSHRPDDVAWLESVQNEITRWTPSQKKEHLLWLREALANELEDAA